MNTRGPAKGRRVAASRAPDTRTFRPVADGQALPAAAGKRRRGAAHARILGSLGVPVLVLLLACGPVRAQWPVPLDPSARASGMGGAGIAVPGGGVVDAWANPALQALGRGVGWSGSLLTTGFLGGLDDRLFDPRVSLAGFGVALSAGGYPRGSGRLEQRPDELFQIEDFSDPTVYSTSDLFDDTGLALSAAGLADGLGQLLGRDGPRLGRWADVAWGHRWRHVHETSDVAWAVTTSLADDGGFARVTPIDTRRATGGTVGRFRLEVAAGVSRLGRVTDGPTLPTLAGEGEDRGGASVRATWWGRAPARAEDATGSVGANRGRELWSWWLRPSPRREGPALDLTLAWDRERVDANVFRSDRRPDPAPAAAESDVHHLGAEATLAGVLSIRAGAVSDGPGGAKTPSYGAGVRVPVGRWATVRYDYGHLPLSNGAFATTQALSLAVDPWEESSRAAAGREEER